MAYNSAFLRLIPVIAGS